MIKYFKESFAELNNVTWPTRKRGLKITTAVLIFMVLSAALFGVVDYLYSLGIQEIIKLKTPAI